MPNAIQTDMLLKGEKEYTEGVSKAYRSLKVLRAELKSETSALDKNASSQEKNAVKAASLKKQLEQQQKIVEAGKKRLEQLESVYKKDSEVVENFKVKLYNSEAAMHKTEQAIKELGDQGEKSGQQLSEKLMKNLEFNQAIEKFRNFGSIVSGVFSGIASTAEGIVSSIHGIVSEVSTAADDLATLADKSGMSVQELLTLRAAQRAGYDVGYEDFANAAMRLKTTRDSKVFQKGGKFEGLAGDDMTNSQVLWNVLNAASRMYAEAGDNATLINSVDEALKEALGKSFSDFAPYLLDGGAGLNTLINELTASGLIRTEEQNSTFVDISNKLAMLDTINTSIKELWTLTIWPAIEPIYTSITKVLTDINAWLNPDDGVDGATASKNLQEHLAELVEKIAEALKTAFEGFVQILNDIAGSTEEDGQTPTTLAKIAQAILDFGTWVTNDLPTLWENLTSTFENLSLVLDAIAGFFGLKTTDPALTNSVADARAALGGGTVENREKSFLVDPITTDSVNPPQLRNYPAEAKNAMVELGNGIYNSFASMINQVAIYLDGEKVGKAVAPTVDQYIIENSVNGHGVTPGGAVW